MSDLILILLVALPLALLFLAVGRRMRRRTRTWTEVTYHEWGLAARWGYRVTTTRGPRDGTRYWILV